MTERKTRAVKFAVPALVAVLLAVCAIVLVMRFFISPRLAFGRFVVRPIPASVKNVKVGRCQISSLRSRLRGRNDRAFVLRFGIRKEDLAQIIAAHGLKRVDYVSCLSERLEYGFIDGPDAKHFSVIGLYGANRRPAPSWFDLEHWTDIEAYAVERDPGTGWKDVGLLLYSEQFGSAYFIEYHGHVVHVADG